MKLWRVEVRKEWTVYVVADSGADACRVAEDDAVDSDEPDYIDAYESEITGPDDVAPNHLNVIPWGDPDEVEDRTIEQILLAIEAERPEPRCVFTRELPL